MQASEHKLSNKTFLSKLEIPWKINANSVNKLRYIEQLIAGLPAHAQVHETVFFRDMHKIISLGTVEKQWFELCYLVSGDVTLLSLVNSG